MISSRTAASRNAPVQRRTVPNSWQNESSPVSLNSPRANLVWRRVSTSPAERMPPWNSMPSFPAASSHGLISTPSPTMSSQQLSHSCLVLISDSRNSTAKRPLLGSVRYSRATKATGTREANVISSPSERIRWIATSAPCLPEPMMSVSLRPGVSLSGFAKPCGGRTLMLEQRASTQYSMGSSVARAPFLDTVSTSSTRSTVAPSRKRTPRSSRKI